MVQSKAPEQLGFFDDQSEPKKLDDDVEPTNTNSTPGIEAPEKRKTAREIAREERPHYTEY